jgi:hypothetical protein
MLLSAVIAVLEPFSLVLSKSTAWQITNALQKGNQLALTDNEGSLGYLRGITPILQPVLAEVEDQLSALMYMRAILDLTSGASLPGLAASSSLSISSGDTSFPGLVVCGNVLQSPLALLLVATGLSATITTGDMAALQSGVSAAVQSFWPSEPVKSTTTLLHLTTTGSLLSAAEIKAQGLSKAQLLVTNNTVTTTPQTFPLLTLGFQKWRGAGRSNTFVNDSGSSSSCPVGSSGASCASASCTDCSSCEDCASCADCGDCSSCCT